MSGRTLIYHADAVEAMRSDLATARSTLSSELDGMFTGVDAQLVAWSESTGSRQAERAFQGRLRDGLTRALDGLDRLEQALGAARDAAENAETRNIALLD
jgi:hypothetical protein